MHKTIITLRRACVAKGYCSRSGRSVALSVDTKRGYVGMCNGRSAQQESGVASSKNSVFKVGA